MAPRAIEKVECPHCGAWFKAGRLACPECGSNAETGWKSAEEIDYLSVDLPEGYGDEEEPTPQERRKRSVWWTAAILALLAALILAGFARLLG